MRNLLITALCGLMALPTVSIGDDHGRPPPPPNHHYNGGYAPPAPYYRGPPGQYTGYHYYGRPYNYANQYYYGYPYYGHNNHHDNDDALWAIGGLIVGAVVATAVHQASAPPPATVYAPAPAAPAENCYDDIIHDSAGNPHVERHCYPATGP
jgi:hypothetical protein